MSTSLGGADSSVPLTEAFWIDQIADRFEAEWRASTSPPQIASYVEGLSGDRRVTLLQELVRIDAECRGRRGGGLPLPDYGSEFPELKGAEGTDHSLLEELAERARRQSLNSTFVRAGETTSAPKLPTAIGRYRTVCRLGSGSQAEVYRVVHPDLGRDVAVKISRRPAAEDPAWEEALRAEGRILADLDHPNLARVYDFGRHEGRPFLVMEYVQGVTLELHAQQAPLAPRAAAELVATLAQALAVVHRHGIIHQDLKPRNILIDRTGIPRIIDFGLARLRHYWSNDDAQPEGLTVAFTSPEQIRGDWRAVGPWSDLYSLGGVLFFLLTGRAPFAAKSAAEMMALATEGRYDHAALEAAAAPRRLKEICRKALQADPQNRYRTAEDFARDLQGFLRISSHRRWMAAALLLPAAGVAAALLAPDPAIEPPDDQPLVKFLRREEDGRERVFTPETPRKLQQILQSSGPLRGGDQIRWEYLVPAGQQATVLLLDTDGTLHDLTPPVAASEIRDGLTRLRIPAEGTWTVGGSPGTMLVLFGPAEGMFRETAERMLVRSGPWPALPPAALLVLEPEMVEALGEQPRGSTDFFEVLDRLESLRKELAATGENFRGMALPQQ